MEHNGAAKDGRGRKHAFVQFIKFNIVGVLNTLVDFVVFQLLNLLMGWTYAAQIISYGCGLVNSYVLNSSWTFRDQRTRSLREIGSFVGVNLVSLAVSLAVIWLCREQFGITDAWVSAWMPEKLFAFVRGDTICKLIATPCAIVVNFIGNRLFVFNKERTKEE